MIMNKKITDFQIYVTKQEGTEPPYENEYHDLFDDGIYVDIYNGEVLFSSKDKFDSHCGWPSFTKPVSKLEYKDDFKLWSKRTEVRSPSSDSHLGHVFDDGPNGLPRYCINSAAIEFIPKEQMVERGYESYLVLFEETK
jgi:peptide-methionine (R)-S-oxide reductase